MRHARLLPLGPLLLLLPGCFSVGLWEWAQDEGPVYESRPEHVDSARRLESGDHEVTLRWSDGRLEPERWDPPSDDDPEHQLAQASFDLSFDRVDDALARVERARRLGVSGAALAADRRLERLRGDPRFGALCAAPDTPPPTFALRAPQDLLEPVDLLYRVHDEPERLARSVPPRTRTEARGGPLGYAAAILATPVTFAVDVVTFPVQVIVFFAVLDAILPD